MIKRYSCIHIAIQIADLSECQIKEEHWEGKPMYPTLSKESPLADFFTDLR